MKRTGRYVEKEKGEGYVWGDEGTTTDETLRRDRGAGGEEKGKRREEKYKNEEGQGATEKRKTK